MRHAEEAARMRGRTLLVLDTRRGDTAEQLYSKLGYQKAGVIPRYARSASGELHDTVFMYREI
jgi:ribosomal protein S18 acetylase RimI-like enzyme